MDGLSILISLNHGQDDETILQFWSLLDFLYPRIKVVVKGDLSPSLRDYIRKFKIFQSEASSRNILNFPSIIPNVAEILEALEENHLDTRRDNFKLYFKSINMYALPSFQGYTGKDKEVYFSSVRIFQSSRSLIYQFPPIFKNNHYKIIIPSYNCPLYLERCLSTIRDQNYTNYEVFVIDDASPDPQHLEVIKKFPYQYHRNEINQGALANIILGINKLSCHDEDIIVLIDGDDWLSSPYVLNILNLYYQDTTLVTYGSYKYYNPSLIGKNQEERRKMGYDPSMIHEAKASHLRQVPNDIIINKSFREHPWYFSHLRTFKYKLWKHIKDEDLRDDKGKYFQVTWDLAIMYPLLEMAGNNIRYINSILYVYNIENGNNDFKKNSREQLETENFIRLKKKYNYLKC